MLTTFELWSTDQATAMNGVVRGLIERPWYEVPFQSIDSESFEKSKVELMKYRNDIRKILEDNTVKDIRDAEDKRFFDLMDAADRKRWGAPFPMSPLDNMAAGFPMRGYPIDTRGLR